MGKQKKSGTAANIIFIIIVVAIIGVTYKFFEDNNFNEYVKSEYIQRSSKFKRDFDRSYRITSKDFNDAMFFRKVKVEKNTPYKVTCKVKTKNVQNEEEKSNGGANISISDTTEKSESIIGTTDWTEIEMLFDSKNRDEIEIGFRLGSYDTNTRGEAWFKDFKITKGTENYDTNWNMGFFIFPNMTVSKNNMTESEIQTMISNVERFKKSVKTLSNNQMTINTNIHIMEEPIETISQNEENGYYIGPLDVKKQIEDIVEKEKIDHVYVIIKLGDILDRQSDEQNGWIGLGGMQFNNVGFSNIRLPEKSDSGIYEYNNNYNTFPEEVYLHEFLHTLERNSKERGYDIPELHANQQYGYINDRKEGLKHWYGAYMTRRINPEGDGLPEEIFRYKPLNKTNFENETELDLLDEPENILEEIKILVNKVKGI